jgi:hypothetical protein
VNGDGKVDLVASVYAFRWEYGFAVLLGNGDGTFRPPVKTVIDTEVYGIELLDFDRDHRLDVIIPRVGMLARGNGDGTFRPLERLPLAQGNQDTLPFADFNGDGRLDVASRPYDPSTGMLSTYAIYFGTGGPLAPGAHAVTAILEDLAGNRSAPSASTLVTVEGG